MTFVVLSLVSVFLFRGDGPVNAATIAARAADALAGGTSTEDVAEALVEALKALAEFDGEIPSNEFPEYTSQEAMAERRELREWDDFESFEDFEDFED